MNHRSRYEGKNLFYLLLSFGVPILPLYFSLVLTIAASESPGGRQQFEALSLAGRIFAAIFYAAQLVCAWYLRRAFFPSPSSRTAAALQYAAVLGGSLLCSVCGAVACEAFGYDLFLRVIGSRS